ncbi:MAG TPA: ATP-dependent zinc metalloprotease FtsH [Candidatus Saccharimonadales bacterium]|nr:ATP-dependent zinc metalloprotease FtsH [Candidatus Saccharimonadales bacterium]
MKPNKPFNSFNPKGILIGIVVAVGLLAMLTHLTEHTKNIGNITYKEFLDKVRGDQVKQVNIAGQFVEGVTKDNQKFQTIVAERPGDFDLFEQHGIDFAVSTPSMSTGSWQVFIVIGVLMLLGLLSGWYLMRQMRGGGKNGTGAGGIFNIGKSKAKMFLPSAIKERFSSVAGAHEAKEDLKDIVDFLRDAAKYRRLGAQITRGVLLVGEPGTGKTLLARAVAGEANCPFFSVSGSDFIEVFVGVGASRVRDLFAEARKKAPCIVFIDEIDAIGRQRGSSIGGGNEEREQTLNQLLTEMDGFETSKEPVIVLAATNRPDVLDKALIRPGRFDRQIEVPVPDLISREEILRVHLKKVKAVADLDVKRIARGTPGFTGADLANLVNEATVIASKKNLTEVTMFEFEEARDKIMLGKESKTMILTEHDKRTTSYHESGHALIRLLMPKDTDPLHKLTIIPRGRALGVTHFLPEREKYSRTKEELLANITSALAGRAAEELVFNELSTGAYSDFKAATEIARSMVCLYGMTDALGKRVYLDTYDTKGGYSQKTFEKIDEEITRILDEQYAIAMKLLIENRDKLNLLAETLLEKETMYAAEVYELLGIEPREDLRLV